MDVRHTIFIAGVIICIMDHEMKLVSGFYLFLWKLDSEPVLPRNLVVGLCSVILLSSYLIYFFHNAYNATNLLREYDFSTSQWQIPLVQKKKRLGRATYCSRSHKIEASGAILLEPLSWESLLLAMGKRTFK